MNIPADLRLCVRVLDILAGEQLRYKSAGGFESRTEKAAHRVMTEGGIAFWTGTPGAWWIRSERDRRCPCPPAFQDDETKPHYLHWHMVNAPALACTCEDHGKSRTSSARSGICHHIICAALCEAGRLEAEEEAHEDEIDHVFGPAA